MTERRHRHHPAAGAGDRRPQPVDESEVAEMIGRELRLPPWPNPGLGARHDPGVSDQQIDVPIRRQEPFGDAATLSRSPRSSSSISTPSTPANASAAAAGRRAGTTTRAPAPTRARSRTECPLAASHHRQPASSMPATTSAAVVVAPNPEPTGRCAARHAATVRDRERRDEHDWQRHDTPMARSDRRLRGTRVHVTTLRQHPSNVATRSRNLP